MIAERQPGGASEGRGKALGFAISEPRSLGVGGVDDTAMNRCVFYFGHL